MIGKITFEHRLFTSPRNAATKLFRFHRIGLILRHAVLLDFYVSLHFFEDMACRLVKLLSFYWVALDVF
jgi:hypothetical protein